MENILPTTLCGPGEELIRIASVAVRLRKALNSNILRNFPGVSTNANTKRVWDTIVMPVLAPAIERWSAEDRWERPLMIVEQQLMGEHPDLALQIKAGFDAFRKYAGPRNPFQAERVFKQEVNKIPVARTVG